MSNTPLNPLLRGDLKVTRRDAGLNVDSRPDVKSGLRSFPDVPRRKAPEASSGQAGLRSFGTGFADWCGKEF